jgi:hypothetical protein
MTIPDYLIEQKAKEFDEWVRRAHKKYPNKGYGADSYDMPGLRLITDKFTPIVRDTRQGDRRGKVK